MSFTQALQSLAFYVISCSPCHRAAEQHHLKQEAKKQREARARNGPQTGYQQPEAFATNPYWSEEINMGPSISRKKHNKHPGQQNLAKARVDTATIVSNTATTSTKTTGATKSTTPTNTAAPKDTVTKTADAANSSLADAKENERPDKKVHWGTTSTGDPQSPPSGIEYGKYQPTPDMTVSLPQNWNHKRYQREDEELWTGHKWIDAIKNAGSSAGRFIESSLGKDAKANNVSKDEHRYFAPVHPPVNDYHPPIVRQPHFKDTIQWMVQPPPAAKLMEGKVPVSRGSTMNGTRRGIAASDTASENGSLRVLTRYPPDQSDDWTDTLMAPSTRPASSVSNRSNISHHSKKSDCQPDAAPVTLHDML